MAGLKTKASTRKVTARRRKTSAVKKLAKKVNLLAIQTRPEKKHKTLSGAGLTVGQVNANTSGYSTSDITPLCASSTTYGGRVGSKIRLYSSYVTMQFFDMASASSNINGRVLIFSTDEPQSSPGSFVGTKMFNYNTFVGGGFVIVDYNSSYNPDYFKEWKLIASRKFRHQQDNITSQKIITNVRIPIKYNKGKGHIIQYDKDSNTVVNGQILMLVLLDNGNNGSTASTLTNVANIAANTGLNMNYNVEHYYFDV